jgi:hypothetical protein
MGSVRSYRDLIVWQRSIDLAKLAYKFARHFPQKELYGLTSQIERRRSPSRSTSRRRMRGRPQESSVSFWGLREDRWPNWRRCSYWRETSGTEIVRVFGP